MNLLFVTAVFVFGNLHLSSAAFVINSAVLQSTATDTNGDGIADTRQEVTFNLIADVNVTIDAGQSKVEITITKPGILGTNPGCISLVDGTTVSATCTNSVYSNSEINWNDQSTVVTTSTNSHTTLTSAYLTGSGELKISTTITYDISNTISNENIQIVQPVSVNAQWIQSQTSPLVFYLNSDILNSTDGNAVITNITQQSYSVEMVGAFLQSTATAPSSVVVGDTITGSITIDHTITPTSTEAARNVQLSFGATQSDTSESPITGINITVNGGSPNSLATSTLFSSSLSLATYTGNSDYGIGNTTVIDFTRSVGQSILLGKAIVFSYTVSWNDQSGTSYVFTKHIGVSPPDLDFTDPTPVDLPTSYAYGDTFQFSRKFTMPTGKLDSNTKVTIEFSSTDMSGIPITVTSFTLAYNVATYPHVTVDSTYTNQVAGSTQQWTISTSSSRRRRKRDGSLMVHRFKRSTTTTWLLSVPLGQIINALSSGSSVSVPITLTLNMAVSSLPAAGSATSQSALVYNTATSYFSYSTATFYAPVLEISKVVSVVDTSSLPHKVRFNMTVTHSSTSNSAAYSVSLKDGSTDFEVFFYENFIPGLKPADGSTVTVDNDAVITWQMPLLNTSESMFMSYKVEPANSGQDFPAGDSTYKATVTWFPTSSTSGGQLENSASVCLHKNEKITESLLYQHGFTVLGLICGIIAGALFGVLIVFLIIICRHRIPCVGEIAPKFIGVSSAGEGLVTSSSATKGFVSIKNLSTVDVNDSIVHTLSMKDKLKQNRQLDNMDIIATIHVDEDIEQERNAAMIKATNLLVASLRLHGDITKGTEEKCRNKFMKNLANSNKNLENEYKKEMQDVFRRLSMKNKAKLEELKLKQQGDKLELEEKLRKSGMTKEEKDELRKLQKEVQEAENEDVNYRLKLEQDEEAEKLRKEYSIRRRMAIKALQQDYLDDVVEEGKLPSQQQIDWLMKEHLKNQSILETMYDEEISRQRMVLEEKLARRKALAQKTELQEDAHSDILNKIASQHLDSIKKAKKGDILSPAEARHMIQDAQKEMMNTKDKMDAERERQEKVLHDKMSQRKKDRMAELKKRQQQELAELDKKIDASMQTNGVDPLTAVQSRQQLISSQRIEASDLENELDREHAKELEDLRNETASQMKTTLQDDKEKSLEELCQNGLSERDMQKLLSKHEKELQALENEQAEDKAKQDANFKKKLAAERKEWARRKALEKEEQEHLREYEANVTQRLVDNLVAMSEEERNKILQEHEKHMVTLENSLTLNKISQKRKLEDKIAKKRAKQLEKLEKKQAVEVKKAKKEAADSEDDDNIEIELMKKHAEEKIAILQGEKLSMEEEMEEIRDSMTKDRANALQDQEVKLAAMLADLQIAKAKEMARIEEQQKAIHTLTINMMDDLNAKGVLSDPDCQKVIKIYQEDQEKLTQKLDSQRAKQEEEFQQRLFQKMKSRESSMIKLHEEELRLTREDDKILRRKFNERLKMKEEQMSHMQQSELNESIKGLGNTPAAKIKRAALLTKHMIEVEKFRNRMEKEISQTLEELRRQNDIRRMNMIQEQDLQFINGLVRLGKFSKEELENVVALLFPTKSNEENKAILDKLMEGYKEKMENKGKEKDKPASPKKGLSKRMSTLEQRVKSASIAKVETASLQGSFKGKKKGRKGRTAHVSPDYDEDFNEPFNSYGHNQRPDPIGRSYTPDQFGDPHYDHDFDMGYSPSHGGFGRTPATKLPPLEKSLPSTKKKKKKKTVAIEDEDF